MMTNVSSSDTSFISVFTPSQTENETLEAIFVGRHALLEDTVERIGESAATRNKHHMLYVGPRGSGKTHLVTLLVHRLTQRPNITRDLHIAWLNEDETSTTLLDLLLRIHQALVKRYPDTYNAEFIEPAYELRANEAQAFVREVLLEAVKRENKTILIIVENLDALFEGLGDVGQKQLRALIQEHPHFAIAATAQKLSEALKNRSHPFFGFFQTTHFKPLTEDEAKSLISKISLLNNRPNVADFLQTRKGQARIRALHHLSGGNHRMYIVLSQFITQDSVDALVPPFVKMVDELTPYYQERLRWLPPQQRKIVEFLSTSTHTVSVKEIAKRLFATHQTISSQLKDLSEKGYVTSTKRGRESLYEVTEPLMRICVEVKENQSHEPLALLVEFIRVWYDLEDLAKRLENEKISVIARNYLLAAYQKNRREQLQKLQEQKQLYEQIIQFLDFSDDPDRAIEAYTGILDLVDIPVDTFITALWGRGLAYSENNEMEKAIADFTALIDLEGAPLDLVSEGHLRRGVAHEKMGSFEQAIVDYTACIQQKSTSIEVAALAYVSRGIVHGEMNEAQDAIIDFTSALNLDSSATTNTLALSGRALAHSEVDDLEHSIADYTAIARIKDAPVDTVLSAQMNKAELQILKGYWSEGFASLRAGLELSVNTTLLETPGMSDLVGAVFSLSLEPTTRKRQIIELTNLYAEYETVTATLGTGLIEHLGSLYQSDELPSPENLESWLSAWEEASEGVDKLRIPMRIFRVGVAFLKTGGQDRGILADLTESERSILEQALGLVEE